jgi:hypothetical protein
MAVSVRGKGPREGLPDYIVKSLARNEVGLFLGVAERHHKVGTVNQRIDPSWLASPPDPFGLPFTTAEARVADGICSITFNYAGQPADYTFSDDEVVFEFDASMTEERIETHPKFLELKQKYGWDTDTRTFSEKLPNAKEGQAALSGKKKVDTKNPLFGLDSWLTVGVIFRKSYVLSFVPSSVLRGIGTVIRKPDGIQQFNMPDASKKRNWLKLAPRITKRGNAVEISEEAMLSGPNGWQIPIYAAGQLEESNE